MRNLFLTIAVLTFISCQCQDQAIAQITDEQMAMAIYHAEGGSAAQYPFGIRSVHCETWTDCKRICKTTIRHKRSRFEHYGYKRYSTYLEYLASRYCPSKGRTLTPAERKLNLFWISNVKYYLKKYNQ